jgi:integrase/recombinase XerD
MNTFVKDGISVASMIDTRKPNSRDEYPVKIRVNFQSKRAYYSTGISLTKADWENLSNNRTVTGNTLRANIENNFFLVRNNVEALADKGDFNFDLLNSRLGRATGDTVNNALRAKIEIFKNEDRIGSMFILNSTVKALEDFGGKNIPFSAINVAWLRKCEQYWSQTKNQTTIGMYFRNIRAIMNEAKKAGVIKESQYPFGKDRFEIKT